MGDPAVNLNANLIDTATPPIPEAAEWLSGFDGRHGPALNLSQAVPGDPPPAEFLEKIAEAARSPEASRYGDIYGDEAVRGAYAAECSRLYQAPIAFDEVAITAGCNQAFFVSIMAIAAAGDAVLLPAPWYFNHKMTMDMLGIETRTLPLDASTGFVPDVSAAASLIDSKVKAIVLVTPNNPTGAVYPPETIAAFLDLAHAKGIRLIIDETYRDFRPASSRPHALYQDQRWRDTVIGLYSFSKAYAIPGHRLGALTASAQTVREIGKILDCVQICPARAAQIALPWAIAHLAEWRGATNAELLKRAATFRSALAAHPEWRIDQIGAYFAYVRHPFDGVPAPVVAEALARTCGLLALPGTYFGPGQDQHLRMAFANVGCDSLRHIPNRLSAFPKDAFENDLTWKGNRFG
ncbi:aminotransferase [Roseibium denhamense]|uniref:Aminotransferase n=1 Tax=Roseibium denhamense TaxID=76305 RepID=A0ABY1PIP1_9HYPH|nr:aminotransferase [Roseibium denhamense]MTI05590.1 aminotransferase [Roseibium denhamense]SMP34539.1 Aspartate/methionine/tyrosine aminotransferase [Roseibium denhamense]